MKFEPATVIRGLGAEGLAKLLREDAAPGGWAIPPDHADPFAYLMSLLGASDQSTRRLVGGWASSHLVTHLDDWPADDWYLLRLLTLVTASPADDPPVPVDRIASAVAERRWAGRPVGAEKDLHRQALFCLASHPPLGSEPTGLRGSLAADLADPRYAVAAHATLFELDRKRATAMVPAVANTLLTAGVPTGLFLLGVIEGLGTEGNALWAELDRALARTNGNQVRADLIRFLKKKGWEKPARLLAGPTPATGGKPPAVEEKVSPSASPRNRQSSPREAESNKGGGRSRTVQVTCFLGTGRRKKAIARVQVVEGSGLVVINDRPLAEYLTEEKDRAAVMGPLLVTEQGNRLDVIVNVKGGGVAGQAGAISQGLARALKTMFSPKDDQKVITRNHVTRVRSYKAQTKGAAKTAPTPKTGVSTANADGGPVLAAPEDPAAGMVKKLRESGYLTRDSRMKERKKYGLRGARRGVQFSKR